LSKHSPRAGSEAHRDTAADKGEPPATRGGMRASQGDGGKPSCTHEVNSAALAVKKVVSLSVSPPVQWRAPHYLGMSDCLQTLGANLPHDKTVGSWLVSSILIYFLKTRWLARLSSIDAKSQLVQRFGVYTELALPALRCWRVASSPRHAPPRNQVATGIADGPAAAVVVFMLVVSRSGGFALLLVTRHSVITRLVRHLDHLDANLHGAIVLY